ncbi:hypothetical protein AAG570_005418 [Ranatra chinensis]|uniref:ENTH domain-containing protein n=1 Tax=Ranatra chinensis TaxID=642074 RepID=A0ABD0YA81_9HEMI
MQVNVAGLRRNLKNLAHNYSDAQVKVREATSNDPWGPSSTLMSDIADLTYNVVAFTEIMQMIWKRLNDHGRNWRHVYKALVLLEYLIKTGSEKVAQQCKENIFAIQTLRDFQYMDEGKDQGLNVREKAKQLVVLLMDGERLKNERTRALKAKERSAQSQGGFGSDTALDTMSPASPSFQTRPNWSSCDTDSSNRSALDLARPQTAGEEELQLQLALAMSREEAEQEEQKRRSDDVRLQLAISQSQNEYKSVSLGLQVKENSHVLDLLDVNLGPLDFPPPGATILLDPWGMPLPPPRPQVDPWSVSTTGSSLSDPWSPLPPASSMQPQNKPAAPNDPWKAPPAPSRRNDPWSPSAVDDAAASPGRASVTSPNSNIDLDEFDIITNRDRHNVNNNNRTISPNPFDMSGLGEGLSVAGGTTTQKRRSPHSFLGENSALVNLDNLVTKPSLPTAPTTASLIPVHQPPIPPGAPLQPVRTAYPPPSQGLAQPLVPQPANPFLS